MNLNLHLVKGLIILDSEGKRIYSKYFIAELANSEAQFKLESQLFMKTQKLNNEIALIDKFVVLYKNNLDCYFYLIGNIDENEVMLSTVLDAFFDSLAEVIKSQIDRNALMGNFDLLCLVVDEMIDHGIVLELDPKEVKAKVHRRSDVDFSFRDPSKMKEVLGSAKERLSHSIFQ